MRLPRTRNIVIAGVAVVGVIVIAGFLLLAQDQDTLRVRTPLPVEDARFPTYLARLLGHTLTSGNGVAVYADGREAFGAMLAAIDAARHRISFETFIYDTGRVADRFTGAFEAACRRGVAVRLVLDSVGASPMDAGHVARLERAGCRIGWFNPVAGYSFEELNFRTHRKALVVDGDVAFVGGMGIADHWAHDTEAFPVWRDTHFELRGPAALDVEAAFHENWIETGGIVEPDLLPHDDSPRGDAWAVTVWSSSEGGVNAMKLLYLMSLAATQRTLDIQSPYLITDESTEWSLLEARRRGVRVRLLVEGDRTDAPPVKFAGRARYARLLEAGIDIYEYQPTMMHAKALIADDMLSIVGSANFDNRSLELNDELNLALFDRALAARLRDDFERDIARSKKLDLEEWLSRPLHIRAREKLWSLFGELF
jgi:cardiolipin synthase